MKTSGIVATSLIMEWSYLLIYGRPESPRVVRYDTSHGFVHRDLLTMKQEKRKTPLFITDRNDALTFAENDIKDNWELYKERFVREGKI